jgi:TetR/AcrR family transcriptional regulator
MIWAMTQHYSDFAPQVKAVLGVSRLTRAEFDTARQVILSLLLGGVLISAESR